MPDLDGGVVTLAVFSQQEAGIGTTAPHYRPIVLAFAGGVTKRAFVEHRPDLAELDGAERTHAARASGGSSSRGFAAGSNCWIRMTSTCGALCSLTLGRS